MKVEKFKALLFFSGYFLALFCFPFGLPFRLMTTTDNMRAVSNLLTLDYPIPDRWTIFQCEIPQAKERRELLKILVLCSYEAVFHIEAHWTLIQSPLQKNFLLIFVPVWIFLLKFRTVRKGLFPTCLLV